MFFARIRTSQPLVFPLALPAAQLWMGCAPLATLQAAVARRAGLRVVDVERGEPLPAGTRVAALDDVVISTATARALMHVATPTQVNVAPGTALHDAVTRVDPARGRIALWGGPLEGRTVDALAGCTQLALCDEVDAYAVRVAPHGPAPHRLFLPQVSKLAGGVHHWIDALELSLAALLTHRREHGLLGARNQIGNNVDIHPTAYVAGSVLHDGVRVEAHASIIGSCVGNGSTVADHTVIVDSALGDNTRTLVDTQLRRVVAQGDCTLSNVMLQDSVLGARVFVTTAVTFFGPNPGETARIGGVDTRRPALGGAIGAGAILGARALLNAGTAIPPGALIVARPSEAVGKLDAASLQRAHTQLGDRGTDV